MPSGAARLDPEAYGPQVWEEQHFQASDPHPQGLRPFVKWVGGKQGLLDQLLPLLPIRFGAYHEPFAGSAALFFALRPRKAHLSDRNAHLMHLYRTVQRHPRGLLRDLRRLEEGHDREQYYAVRDAFNEAGRVRPILRAAWFLYLNKTCYNGLWRVNRRGAFNVPIGRYQAPRVADPGAIRRASEALAKVELRCCSYEEAVERVEPGDFVYLDPPYVPLSPSSSFTGYQAGGFGEADQRRLRDVFALLDARGAQVMLSNSDTELVWELYRGFRIDRVQARRSINSRASGRGPITEVVVRNFYLDRAGAERVRARLAAS